MRDENGLVRTLSTGAREMSTHLTVPTIPEEKEVKAIEYKIEHQTTRSEELAAKPAFRHLWVVPVLINRPDGLS